MLVLHQIKVSSRLRHLVLIHQIVNDHPRLRVIKGMVRPLAGSRPVVLHSEQVHHRQPHWRTHQLRQRLWSIRVPPQLVEDVLVPLRRQFRVASNVDLLADLDRAEIFREAFVKPARRRRIVVIHKIVGQRMRHRPPRFSLKQIQDDINAIRPRHIESACEALFCRSNQTVLLVVLERDHGDRHRHFQLVF